MSKQRAELHLHTTMSAMDGVSTVTDYINAAIYDKMPAIAVTDHASVQAFPEAYSTIKKYSDMDLNLKLIYGNEIYMVDDNPKAVFGKTNEKLCGIFTIVDIETTGLDPVKDKITEIAAYKIKDGAIIDSFTTLVNPEVEISEEISNITGITNDMVKDAPTIKPALKSFVEFYDGSVIVAHNARFDISFLKSASKECNIDFTPAYIDTLTIAKTILPDCTRYKLATICEELKIEHTSQHRAFGDAKATAEMFLSFCEKLKAMGVDTVEKINDVMTASKRGRRVHATILVLNKIGLKNLYKLVSMANTDNFYKVPITLKRELKNYRDGLLLGSGCDSGELYHAVRDGLSDDELCDVAEFYDYLEIVPTGNFEYYVESGYVNSMDDLVAINKKIIEIGEMTSKPVVAVSDSHYVHKDDMVCRKILMKHQGYVDYNNQPLLSMRTTDEMLAEFSYLGEDKAYEIVVENPNEIVEKVDDLFPPIETEITYDADIKELVDLTYKKLNEKYGDRIPQECLNRIDWELSIIGQNERSIYNILLSAKLVEGAVAEGWTVGTRGSIASSYIAYLLGITEINPLEAHYYCPDCHYVEFHNEYNCGADMDDKICECGTKLKKDGFTIPHETFFGIDGTRDIDIDFNFSPEYQVEALQHLKKLVGTETVHCGTISTFSDKLARTMVSEYCKKEGVKLNKSTKEEIVRQLSYVKRTTGMHPGGVLVLPKDKEIHDYTPVQYPANYSDYSVYTTHFDYYSLLDLLKVDILAHDMPSMLRYLEKLTGINSKDIPLDDEKTKALFSSMKTRGVPEFGTRYVREYLMSKINTDTFDNLIRISGLSHGTDVWYDNGENLIEEGVKISDIVSCRDDVMLYLITLGLERKEAFRISDRIRKGKGLTEEQYCMLLNEGVEEWRLESWNKIKYSFPRAHAASYVLLSYRIAYYKAHYPLEFYAAYYTINAELFNADTLINNAEELPNEIQKINNSKSRSKNLDLLALMEVCQEMYDEGYKFVSDKIKKEKFTSFFVEDGKIRPRIK